MARQHSDAYIMCQATKCCAILVAYDLCSVRNLTVIYDWMPLGNGKYLCAACRNKSISLRVD